MAVAIQVVHSVFLDVEPWNLTFPYQLTSELVLFEGISHTVYPFDKLVIRLKTLEKTVKFL
jgi:hypothetical protein